MSALIDVSLAIAWTGGAVALVLAVHAAARRLLPPQSRPEGEVPGDGHDYPAATRDAAAAIGLRMAALYGVILALVYAQELGDYDSVKDGLAREAVAIADVYNDAARYGGPAAPVIRRAMHDYVRIVVDREWRVLTTEKRLSQRGWNARERAYAAVLDLSPRTPREIALRERMLKRLGDIAEFRHLRQELSAKEFGAVFWLPALTGLALVAFAFFVFPPTRETRWLLSAFGAFAGLILFLIQAFSNPFSYPLHYPPGPFQRLLETDIGSTPMPPAPGVRPGASSE